MGSEQCRSVLAHEEGHNFGRQHSPCGGVANPDPNYPYAGGLIGVPGWDAFAASGNLKTSADHHDVMTYCSNLWVSDYTYKGVLSFRLTSPLGVVVSADAQAKATPKEGLLVWGRLVDGKMILEPAFRVPLTGENVEPGSYVWEARDGAGQLLASVPFHPTKVEDLPFASEEHFAFVVPLESAVMEAIRASRVMKDGLELARLTALSPERSDSALKSVRVQNLLGRTLLVQWDANANPVLMFEKFPHRRSERILAGRICRDRGRAGAIGDSRFRRCKKHDDCASAIGLISSPLPPAAATTRPDCPRHPGTSRRLRIPNARPFRRR